MSDLALTVALTEEVLDEVAERVAAKLAERQGVTAASTSPYMTIAEAADFLRCERQRIYNHFSARRLSRLKEGGRTLVSRSELEELVRQETTQRCHARL